jgi:hypothetical protein
MMTPMLSRLHDHLASKQNGWTNVLALAIFLTVVIGIPDWVTSYVDQFVEFIMTADQKTLIKKAIGFALTVVFYVIGKPGLEMIKPKEAKDASQS